MTKTEYCEYLAGEHWQTLRREHLEVINWCERCELPRWLASLVYDQDLHLHHVSYAHLGDEHVDDLMVLCARCHELETFGRSELKAPKSSKCSLCGKLHWDPRAEFCPSCDRILEGPYLAEIAPLPHSAPRFPTVGDYIRDLIGDAEEPPKKPEEAAELGWMLLEGRTSPGHFQSSAHRLIYAAMLVAELRHPAQIARRGEHPVDIVNTAETLAEWRAVEAIGGVPYLASLTEGLPRRRPGVEPDSFCVACIQLKQARRVIAKGRNR